MAVQLGEKLDQLDISGAYLYSDLEEEIYMNPPLGYDIPELGSTLRLVKAIYGLKQSGRAWFLHLKKRLQTIGFKPLSSDPYCIYI